VSIWNPPPYRQARAVQDGRAERPAGRPPWVPARRPPAGAVAFAALVAAGAVGGVVSLLVAAWRLLDHASDLR
jgi:hypothetical protein